MTILHLDASVRRTDNLVPSHNSISKQIAASFMDVWLTNAPQATVIHRDIGINPPGFISQDWIAAAFTPEPNRTAAQRETLALSDELIKEVIAADTILISTPMYNYGLPAALKAWFDQVIRINKTFSFDLERGDFPLSPTLAGKTLVLITSTGEFGFEAGGVREAMNHLGPHIRVMSRYLGVEQTHEISAGYQEFGDSRHQASLKAAYAEAAKLARSLAQREPEHSLSMATDI
ncbi:MULTISPECIES: FMN-dependent NADH-azoreductase [Photobacterium]|uniref:FMN dependent NADH:quinone oxidoreductase n=1 Tax=Photobacterium halotolerans TaxID=265726 RepID=A0A0F5VC05_9GAMM|nr:MULTISPECIES: NAD(P)H-dependent oxidoreductase [Photobacterium]KKC99331.1 FMN-dependent NADH-azoreductase [Photobacterium halotolerans]UIP29740.1 NAD(P)H-dependent oxidoreductase [Photobacterium sp. TLY01]